ncbi:MAG: hypothetical protein ACTHOB_18365 [Ginsengibacter sp.]
MSLLQPAAAVLVFTKRFTNMVLEHLHPIDNVIANRLSESLSFTKNPTGDVAISP